MTAGVNPSNADEEARRRAEADRADELTRQHGQDVARRAMAMVNQPMRPPMNLDEVCAQAEHADDDVVLVAVPREIILLMDFPQRKHYLGVHWGTRLKIPEGVHEMPRSLAEHWWVQANGVKPYRRPGRGERGSAERMYSPTEMEEALKRARAEGEATAASRAPAAVQTDQTPIEPAKADASKDKPQPKK